jgi:heme exporter protein D
MERRLAGFFALLGIATLIATWLYRSMALLPALPPERLVYYAILVFWVYFLVGLFLSKVGVSLIQEVLAEKRIREEERRNKARALYQARLDEEEDEEADSGS